MLLSIAHSGAYSSQSSSNNVPGVPVQFTNMYIGWGGFDTGDGGTLNAGATSFNMSAPSGFTAWDNSGSCTWDPSNKSPNITLSGGNLIATSSNGGAGNGAAVRSTTGHLTGKWYFEITCNNLQASFSQSFGIMSSVAPFNTMLSVSGFDYVPSGQVWSGGQELLSSGWSGVSSTQVVGIAVDLDKKLIWARTSASSTNWNGSTSNNPATGVGGYGYVLGMPQVTTGNLLIFFLHTDTGTAQPTINTSAYTVIGDSTTDGTYQTNTHILARYAQSGDSSGLPALCTAGSSEWAWASYEIAGVAGTLAQDLQTVGTFSFINNFIYPPLCQQTPQTSNCIALGSGGNWSDNGSIPTPPSGWTADCQTNIAPWFNALQSYSQVNPTAGTAIGATALRQGSYGQVILQSAPPSPIYPYIRSTKADSHFNSVPNVQYASLEGAPVAGNLIIAILEVDGTNGLVVNTTGWTQFDAYVTGGNTYTYGLYRYAQGGDAALLPAFFTNASGSLTYGWQVYEIAGVTGFWVTDFKSDKTGNTHGTSMTTTSDTTALNNSLVLLGIGQNLSGSSATNPTVSSGWAAFDAIKGTGVSFSASKTYASSGSSVSATVTVPTSTDINWMQVILNPGPVYAESESEALGLSDSASVAIAYSVAVTEALGLTDSEIGESADQASDTEHLGLSDSASAAYIPGSQGMIIFVAG